ncbi:hypothetical protein CK203_029556 [Vitis vinifera]|uniref:Uncharacterized protein n=1 Tax=Vitis vinifera TaxID=29760 RepID=A0A438JCB5_VITVI|nr:hypothetical protein CK203_029556 [Vitis vinifera]
MWWSERDGLEVVRNPKSNDQLAMMKEKDKGVKINDDLKIWVIENEIRDCVDGNATTMASENEYDEKFVINLNKNVIKRVDGGNLMEMDKTFQQLKTHLIDMAYGASSSSCDQILAKFEENYTTVKGLFLRSSGKPLRMHEEGTKNDMLSCERSLEDTNNMNVNEHYLHTLSNEKLCIEDLNEKNEDACATSIEEPLRALCGYPNHVMKTRSSKERKPSKFKVSPFVHKLRKMVKREASESIPMSIHEDVVDTRSFNVLQSLVVDYVFNKALSKSELLVDFGHEHGVRGGFECLRPRQNLMDVQMILCGSPHPFFDRKTSIVSKYISELDDCEKLFIPMHDECPGHWERCLPISIDWAPSILTQENGVNSLMDLSQPPQTILDAESPGVDVQLSD